jgi:hypothetical protein
MFAVLPVDDAIQWLESMTSDDPATLVAFAEKQVAAKEWKDAIAAAERAKALDKGGKLASKIKAVTAAVAQEAGPRAKTLEKAIVGAKDDSWVADFDDFRGKFEFAEPAKAVMAAWRKLHDEHEKPAETLFFSARGDFNSNKPDDGYRKCESWSPSTTPLHTTGTRRLWLKNRK